MKINKQIGWIGLLAAGITFSPFLAHAQTDQQPDQFVPLTFDDGLGNSNQEIQTPSQAVSTVATSDSNKENDFKKQLDELLAKGNIGDAESQAKLAIVYGDGLGVPRDSAKAMDWMMKAANQGFAPAEIAVGNRFLGEKNWQNALSWFIKAAQKNDPEGASKLAFMYENGLAVSKDPVQAAAWYGQAAKLGNLSASIKLGELYQAGMGVEKNPQKALELWKQAAEKNMPLAQFFIGRSYHMGQGVEQSDDQAIQWLKKASLSGMPQAQYWIGAIYDHGVKNAGQQSKPDFVQAAAFYAVAASQGYPPASASLASFYMRGIGVSSNPIIAAHLYDYAASKGLPVAEFNLASLLELGLGVKKDTDKALELYKRAADQGFEPAKKAMDKLQSSKTAGTSVKPVDQQSVKTDTK